MSDIFAHGALNVSFGEICDRGKVREENQDNVRNASIPLGELFIVADGIGGYQGGATASRMVVEGFYGHLATRQAGYPPANALMEACTATNAAIFDRANSGDPAYQRMGSTVVLALIQPGANGESDAWIGHVGDSRAYLIHRGQMHKVTNDHSAVQALLNKNLITEEEARNHPDASVLTRSLGHRPDVEIEIDHIILQPGDSLLLCSDGLWGYVNDADIATVATDPSLSAQTAARLLLDQALAAGGPDNIGIEFIHMEGAAGAMLPSMPPPPKTAIPAAFQAPGSALPTLPRDNKRKLELIAFALLLVGSGGYLAYAAHSHLWPFRSVPVKTNDTTNTGTPSAPQPKDSHNPEPQRNKPAARTQDHHPGAPHSDQPAAQPTAQPTNQPAEQNADQPTDRSANQPGNQHETQPSPQPQPSGQQPSNPQADQGHHLRRNIVIAGDVEPNRHHDLESPLLSIKHENRRECMALAKDHTVIYRHSGETAESILQRYPDIKGHIDERDHKLESRDLTADIRAACGQEFDVVVILARKPGQVSGMNPNPGTASNDPDHPAAAPRSKLRLQPMQ